MIMAKFPYTCEILTLIMEMLIRSVKHLLYFRHVIHWDEFDSQFWTMVIESDIQLLQLYVQRYENAPECIVEIKENLNACHSRWSQLFNLYLQNTSIWIMSNIEFLNNQIDYVNEIIQMLREEIDLLESL